MSQHRIFKRWDIKIKIIICMVITTVAITSLYPGLARVHANQTLPGCELVRSLSLQTPTISGPDVEELQRRLNELGHGPLIVDGTYGPLTAEAIRSFQLAAGMPSDGVAGPGTWEALGADVRPATGSSSTAPPEGQISILVDTNKLQLTVLVDGEPFKTYPVAVGRPNRFTLSPVGEWTIIQKDINWGGGFGTRWLGLNVPWGIYGIHGTNKPWSIGRRESAGCIRMHNRDVEELYEWIPRGTKVTIVGVDPQVSFNRTLRSGTTGPDVVYVQFRLSELGFDPQGADGRYGPNTEIAVKQLQQLYGLPVDGRVYDDIYYLLGLK